MPEILRMFGMRLGISQGMMTQYVNGTNKEDNMDKTKICSQAILSNQGDMTSFRFGNNNIRLRSPKCLKHYVDIKEWDNGYLVVMADYEGLGLTEEYIDLVPIMENLYMDSEAFLKPIKSVKIGEYDYE